MNAAGPTGAGRSSPSVSLLIEPGTYLISVRGDLDGGAGPFVEHELGRLVGAGAREVVIDLVETAGLDESRLAQVAAAGVRFSRDADVTIACESPRVLRLLELGPAGGSVHVAGSLTEAFARLARNRIRPAA